LAVPGEFTKRAFLNGRLDLAQAESVMDVIASRTERSLALAQSQREGTLSRELAAVRTRLVESLALVEAYIDFPDDEVDPAVFHQVEQQVESAAARLVQLVDSYKTGRVLREGVSVLLLGRPNAGKSSLLNALSGSERAIVSDLPGTTRDLIEEGISLDGLPVKIIDAAGIRAHHADCVEREGVRRALDKLSVADLALFVVDGSVPLNPDDRSVVASIAAVPYFIVVTKSDLPRLADVSEFTGASGTVMVSTKNGTGIDQLARMLYDYFVVLPDPTSDDHAVLSNVRHRDVLMRAVQSLYQFLANSKAGLPVELLSLDLRGALSALGEVTGETSTDEVLDLIFSSFCIGK
jgi:tRNA modification GTPase